MSLQVGDEHVRAFARSLNRELDRHGRLESAEFLARQKEQVELLCSLEDDFRRALLGTQRGKAAYRAFVREICDRRRNILSARPFFRERQKVFSGKISAALKRRSADGLHPFHVNFQFIEFAMKFAKVRRTKARKIYDEIRRVRQALIETNLPLALNRATIFWSRTPKSHLAYMDMLQICAEGLISGIDKFCLPFSRVFRSVSIGRMVGNLIEQSSVLQDTILLPVGQPPKKIKDFIPGDRILCVGDLGEVVETTVVRLYDHGTLPGYEVEFEDGYKITCTENHKFLTEHGMVPVRLVAEHNLEVFCEPTSQESWLGCQLWTAVRQQAEALLPLEGLRGLPGGDRREAAGQLSGGSGGQGSRWWMEVQVRAELQGAQGTLQPQGGVPGLQGLAAGGAARVDQEVEGGAPGGPSSEHGRGEQGVPYPSSGGPGAGEGSLRESDRGAREVVPGEPGGLRGDRRKVDLVSQGFRDGGVAEVERHADVGGSPNQVRCESRGTEAGRLRLPGPQNLGGGGRVLALLDAQADGAASQGVEVPAGPGRDAQPRVPPARRCGVGQVGAGVFSFDEEEFTGRVVDLAPADAPLSCTRGLLRRRVVRVSPVGVCRMYDIEVAHPKHNFLLPSGLITSNSETVIHFYPPQKRKLYRANKVVRQHKGVDGVDWESLAADVNKEAKRPEFRTTPEEIATLMSAASCVSADAPLDDEVRVTALDRAVAPEDTRPDVAAETREVEGRLAKAVSGLQLVDQKLLRMRGCNFWAGAL